MSRLVILCIELTNAGTNQKRQDWCQVFDSLSNNFETVVCHSVEGAQDYIATHVASDKDRELALVVHQSEPSIEAKELLSSLDSMPAVIHARKILFGQKWSFKDVLHILNQGRLDYCIDTAITNEELLKIVQSELTTYVLNKPDEDWLKYSSELDQNRILRAHIEKKFHDFNEGFIHDFHGLADEVLTQKVVSALRKFFANNSDGESPSRTYSAEHLLTQEGQENRFLWFITEGEVALYKKDDFGQQREVVRYSKGNIVGGMSFVTGERSFSTAVTLSRTEVIKIDNKQFSQFMHSDSELLPLFTNLLLRHFNRRLQRSIDNKIKLQETLESLENTQQKLVEGEKMAVLGQLVAGVAHELNNPVAAILRGADTISKNLAIVLDQANSTSEPLLDLPSGFNTEKIFRNALTATPMSTAEVRQQVKSLDASIDDRQISKKIVQFGMAKPFFALGTSKPMNAEALRAAVNHVEPYYHLGSTLRSVNVCASRIADMVKSLKGYAREDDEKLHHVDIHVGIEDTLVIFENRLKHHDVEKHYAELPKVLCMPIALQQVWTNLVSNSLDAMSSSGKLTISTKLADVSNRKYVCVSFKDSGSGIPQNIIDTIFELNYTTKKEGNFGLGIGLSVCQQILAQHSGWIEVQSIEGEYTLMDVFLPIN